MLLGRGVNYTPPSSAVVKERVELYLYNLSLWAFMDSSRVYNCTRWFKYDWDKCGLFTHKAVPVIFEVSCTMK
jgi:hypothetical protein